MTEARDIELLFAIWEQNVETVRTCNRSLKQDPLIANVLTVTFVYCFAKIHQSLPERKRVVSFCCSCRALHLDPIGKA